MIQITEKKILVDLLIEEIFLGSFELFYFIAFIFVIGISIIGYILLRKLRGWEGTPLYSAGNETNYWGERWHLKTLKEGLLEVTVLIPTLFFGCFYFFGLFTFYSGFEINYLHIRYTGIIFSISCGCFLYIEITLNKKLLPRYKLFAVKKDQLEEYFVNTIEQPLINLLTDNDLELKLEGVSSYNIHAKRILKKYILEVIDKNL